ncbi:hypothetical protein RSOLAG1IB_09829 [Rhizoctonia solani AG-1 IB]|uniref:Uncharacterized protein n=1 Tax=Thanatephorus cucumeris (strain AG1-IB / isolate 7/3/14) TaxID=1108050 RepID=A0A0B7FTB8_THACB|nr:hypothetical protein RSOLAG1IB_09829 [Rhizoctonia solani AG-1 IB]
MRCGWVVWEGGKEGGRKVVGVLEFTLRLVLFGAKLDSDYSWSVVFWSLIFCSFGVSSWDAGFVGAVIVAVINGIILLSDSWRVALNSLILSILFEPPLAVVRDKSMVVLRNRT